MEPLQANPPILLNVLTCPKDTSDPLSWRHHMHKPGISPEVFNARGHALSEVLHCMGKFIVHMGDFVV